MKRGFTIVELLIVIVVIAILAAISIVAYNGIQQRARDSQRKNDVAAIAKALKLYRVDNGDLLTTGSGCGFAGNGSGWYNHTGSGGYQLPINQCLVDAEYIQGEIIDPSGARICTTDTCHAYFKFSCGSGTFLYANLETLPQSSTATDGTCAPDYDEQLGINYVVKVE